MNSIIKKTLHANDILNRLPKSISDRHVFELNVPDEEEHGDLPPSVAIHLDSGHGSFLGLPLPVSFKETDIVFTFSDEDKYTITFWKKSGTSHITVYK